MCKMVYRTASTCSPSCLTHNNQRATVPFKARTHISRGTDDTTVRNSVNIILTNSVLAAVSQEHIHFAGAGSNTVSCRYTVDYFYNFVPSLRTDSVKLSVDERHLVTIL